MFGTKMVLRFVLHQAREAFSETAFVAAISAAIARELRANAVLNSVVDNVNSMAEVATERVLAKYKGLGPTGYLLKAAIAAHMKDLAKDHPDIAMGMATGTPYLEAVLDGLTVEDLLHGSKPITGLVLDRAKLLVKGES